MEPETVGSGLSGGEFPPPQAAHNVMITKKETHRADLASGNLICDIS
jgi:hypothetical protein